MGKLPGYLSRSMGIKFANGLYGLAAIIEVPTEGWARTVAYGAFGELSRDQSVGTPGGLGDPGSRALTSSVYTGRAQ